MHKKGKNYHAKPHPIKESPQTTTTQDPIDHTSSQTSQPQSSTRVSFVENL